MNLWNEKIMEKLFCLVFLQLHFHNNLFLQRCVRGIQSSAVKRCVAGFPTFWRKLWPSSLRSVVHKHHGPLTLKDKENVSIEESGITYPTKQHCFPQRPQSPSQYISTKLYVRHVCYMLSYIFIVTGIRELQIWRYYVFPKLVSNRNL